MDKGYTSKIFTKNLSVYRNHNNELEFRKGSEDDLRDLLKQFIY